MFKKLTPMMLILILLLAVACAGGGDEVAAPTAVPEAAGAVEEAPTTPPTAVPTTAPAAPVAEATEAQPAPTAPPTALPTATAVPQPEAVRAGLVRFRDSDAASAGSFQLLMEGIAPPAAGTHYELWLADDRFNTLNLGAFEVVDGNVQVNGATEQNLLSAFNTAFISIEPDGVDDGEIGVIAFEGVIPAESLLHVRHVVTAFPGNPDGKAFLFGAQEQLHHAMEHAGFLLDELASDNIREAQRHAEHVVNILDGETGANFGDLDGDSLAQNPGDGVGVRGYLEGAKQHTTLAAEAPDVTAEVLLHAEHVQISSDNALAWIEDAIGEALRVIASDSAAEAQDAANNLTNLLAATMDGVDANGDGAVAPIPDEGGIVTAYVHALNMGAFEFFATDDAAAAAAPVEEAAEPAAEAAPTEAPPAEAAAPEPVTIEMANFAYVPNEITVAAGTAVTWINKDSGPRHSATASDGSFDTGLFDEGNTATVTFDTPGTYVYYCLLHGSPDGSGMAATITVTGE